MQTKAMLLGCMAVVLALRESWAGPAPAPVGLACRADKLKVSGKYASCRADAAATAVTTGLPPDYRACEATFAAAFAAAEARAGGRCPTKLDRPAVQSQVDSDTVFLAQKLRGERFIDNGDGTITDTQTGLMWEKKTDDGGIHDKDTEYSWTATGASPNGTAFTTFLGGLNTCTSPDGKAITGGFAGHCDWRLPSAAELHTLLLSPCAKSPCIDPAFGPALAGVYWSSTQHPKIVSYAWYVLFDTGETFAGNQSFLHSVRAVRGATDRSRGP